MKIVQISQIVFLLLATTGVAAQADFLSSALGVIAFGIDLVNTAVSVVIPGFNINVADVILTIVDVVSDLAELAGIDIPNSEAIAELICDPILTAIAAAATCTCLSDSSVEGSLTIGIKLDCTGTSEVCLEEPSFCGTPTFEGVLNVDLTKQGTTSGNYEFTVPSAKSCVDFNTTTSPAASQPFCIEIPISATITGSNFTNAVIELDNDKSITKLGDELCNANLIPCVDDEPLSIDIDCSNVATTGGVSGPDPDCLDLISFETITRRRTLSKQLHLDQLLDSSVN